MSQENRIVGTNGEALEFEELERLPSSCPTPGDVRIRASLSVGNFKGEYSEVWLAKPDVKAFVRVLNRLHRGGIGTAKLEAMSPKELKLELNSLKRINKYDESAPKFFFVDAMVGQFKYTGNSGTGCNIGLTAGLEISEDQLAKLIRCFEGFL